MKIALVGPSRSGKDTAAEWLAGYTTLRYALSTSAVIAPHAAERLGLTVEEAFRRRHQDREHWFHLGNELRAADPAFLARRTLEAGDICVGVRDRAELEAVRREGLCDLVLWVDREVPEDPTLTYGVELADVVIPNRWGIGELHGRLERLARALGVLVAGKVGV